MDYRSPEAQRYRVWYSGPRWRAIRAAQLSKEPLCRFCNERGLIVAANVVDHVIKHGGDEVLMWDTGNLQSLCKKCHDGRKQSEERRGYSTQMGADGWPTDARHRANGGTPDLVVGTVITHPTWFRPVYIPLTIVCGPPGSGKSTYVRNNAGPDDLVICFDQIAAGMFATTNGKRAHSQLERKEIGDVLRKRNEMIADLMRAGARSRWPAAWLIISEPRATNRQWWADRLKPKQIVVMLTPPDLCASRIAADAKAGDARFQGAPAIARKWWDAYTPRQGDTEVIPDPTL